MASLISRFFAFAFVTTLRRTLGITWYVWLRLLLLFAAIFAFVSGRLGLAFTLFVLLLLLRIGYRIAERRGYFLFDEAEQEIDLSKVETLPPTERVALQATGVFSAGENERQVLLKSAEMWHVPRNQHIIMVESGPGNYLYQFVEPAHTKSLRLGTLTFGTDQWPAIEVVYLTDWSPTIDHSALAFFVGGGEASIKRQLRTIVLAFKSIEDQHRVWKSFQERK